MLTYNYVTDTLYPRARSRGRWAKVWSTLSNRSRRLVPLSEVEATGAVTARYDIGVQTVPIRQICGSGGRPNDFDHNFNPLRDHTRQRWLGIAEARQQGQLLPPVELIRVGDVYFVGDGHHRISVAQAMGQKEIEAKVTVWQVAGLG